MKVEDAQPDSLNLKGAVPYSTVHNYLSGEKFRGVVHFSTFYTTSASSGLKEGMRWMAAGSSMQAMILALPRQVSQVSMNDPKSFTRIRSPASVRNAVHLRGIACRLTG